MSRVSRARSRPDGPARAGANDTERPADPTATVSTIRFSLGGFLLFVATLIAASGGLVFAVMRATASEHEAPATALSDDLDDEEGLESAAPTALPPWGELWIRDLDLDRPAEYAAFEIAPRRPTWLFPSTNREQVAAWLREAHVAEAEVARALGPELSELTPEGFAIHPDLALALTLTPDARAQLYRVLAGSPANRLMVDPYRFRADDVERWFTAEALGQEPAGLLRRLSYACGKLTCFSDYELLLARLPDAGRRVALAKALSRRHIVLVRLRVRPNTDLDRELGYWGRSGSGKDLRPLMESLRRLPHGGTLSIGDALPPFARLRLNTFPVATDRGDDPVLNCHWSTFNFFNEVPDDRFSDWSFVRSELDQHFTRVGKASQYGDRIVLVDAAGSPVHSAVYIAEDIVFTKNGNGVSQPWVLMHFDDMFDYYDHAAPLTVLVYRSKDR